MKNLSLLIGITMYGGEMHPVVHPDFKSGRGRQPVFGGFDSHSLPPRSNLPGPTARAGGEFCQAHGLRIALTHDRNRLRYQGVAIDGACTRDPMTGSTAANSLAEEGARVTRAINDSIKRFSAMSGPNFMPEGMPPFMQAAQEYNAKLLE